MQAQLTQLYRQQIFKHGANNLFEWIINQLESKETELANILRWEDDGGLIIQTPEAVIEPALVTMSQKYI